MTPKTLRRKLQKKAKRKRMRRCPLCSCRTVRCVVRLDACYWVCPVRRCRWTLELPWTGKPG